MHFKSNLQSFLRGGESLIRYTRSPLSPLSLSESFLAVEVTVHPVPLYSVERRVKEIMHKAFWDCLEAQLKEDPPSYGHAIKLLAEIKEVRQRFLFYSSNKLALMTS